MKKALLVIPYLIMCAGVLPFIVTGFLLIVGWYTIEEILLPLTTPIGGYFPLIILGFGVFAFGFFMKRLVSKANAQGNWRGAIIKMISWLLICLPIALWFSIASDAELRMLFTDAFKTSDIAFLVLLALAPIIGISYFVRMNKKGDKLNT